MSICQVPETSQAGITPILAGILGMLAFIMVMLRLVRRCVFDPLFGIDDGLILAALICAAPLNCLMFPSKLAASLESTTATWDSETNLYSAEIWPGD